MTEQKRYSIFSLAPKQIKLEDYGLQADAKNYPDAFSMNKNMVVYDMNVAGLTLADYVRA